MEQNSSIGAIGHIPHYSKIFLRALKTPLLLYIAALGNFLLFISAALFYHFETAQNARIENLFDAVWWAFTTVSTVGFGDITPVTTEGRIVGIFLMITGVTLFVGFTAIFVSVISSLTTKDIVKGEELTDREYQQVMDELRRVHSKLEKIEQNLAKMSGQSLSQKS